MIVLFPTLRFFYATIISLAAILTHTYDTFAIASFCIQYIALPCECDGNGIVWCK
jgi:hypothetical protein